MFSKNYPKVDIPSGEGAFSVLAGINYSHFNDRLLTHIFDKKFELGFNIGMEKEVGSVNINLSYKTKSTLHKEKLSAEDKEYGEKAAKVEIDLSYLSLASLIPLNLADNLTFLPGFEIAQAVSDDFKPDLGSEIKTGPNYNFLLCIDWYLIDNYSLRFEYSHGLNEVYNTDISEIYNRSFSLYFKYGL
ncbi:MAG: hypothetical protein ACLFQM_02775 [Fidelibacterota bacterium]